MKKTINDMLKMADCTDVECLYCPFFLGEEYDIDDEEHNLDHLECGSTQWMIENNCEDEMKTCMYDSKVYINHLKKERKLKLLERLSA